MEDSVDLVACYHDLAIAVIRSAVRAKDAAFAQEPVFEMWAKLAFPDCDPDEFRRAWTARFPPHESDDIMQSPTELGVPVPLGRKRHHITVRVEVDSRECRSRPGQRSV